MVEMKFNGLDDNSLCRDGLVQGRPLAALAFFNSHSFNEGYSGGARGQKGDVFNNCMYCPIGATAL